MTDLMPNVDAPVELPIRLPDPRPSDPLEALSWLGETEEEVVEALRERGIKGIPMDPSTCLIAQYLAVWWDEPNVGLRDLEVDEKNNGPVYRTPWVIEQVIGHFDADFYPDLIAD